MTCFDLSIAAAGFVWWTFTILIFALSDRDEPTWIRISNATLWPVLVPVALVFTLWRIPFRSARAIRSDLRNRKILREFDEFLKNREDKP